MATTLTLQQIIDQTRQRADFVNSQFVTDAELTNYINQSYFELYDLLVSKYDNDYFVAPPLQFQTNGQDQFYPLPDGVLYNGAPALLKLLGVDLCISPTQNDSWITIRQFNWVDRNRYAVPNFQSFYGVTNLRYRVKANDLWLTPIPAGGQTMQLWYIPRLEPLVSPTDTADGISGWIEYVIVDAAIKMKDKEESDTSVMLAEKAALIKRIEYAAENRDSSFPATVGDTQYNDFWWPTGSGNGDGSGAF